MAPQRKRPAARARANRPTPPVSAQCARLLALVRQNCPDLLPPTPLPAGSVGPEIPVDRKQVGALVQAAADPGQDGSVVWMQGDCELQVHVSKVTTSLAPGVVRVSVPVFCEETGDATIGITFAIGDAARPAGMFAATELRPRGPVAITLPWGDALIAFAWGILLEVAAGVADGAGVDEDGAGLIPAAIASDDSGLRILTQARHPFDRVTA